MADVFICGAGIRLPGHLTLETLDALQRCTTIYSVLPPSTGRLLPTPLCDRFESLLALYQPGARRSETYTAQVNTVIHAALHSAPVAYLAPGTPLFFDSVTTGLVKSAQASGLSIALCAGVSSLDTMLLALQADVAPGLQVYDSSALLMHDISLRPDIACILVQLNVFGTLYVAGHHRASTDALQPLRDHLLRFHPPEHTVFYVFSSGSPDVGGSIQSILLRELASPDRAANQPGASLFIPPSNGLTTDDEFVHQMLDRARLAAVYGIDPKKAT